MTTSAATVSQKLWNYCNVLRDTGLSYGDYLEQLTYLIFLKMMDELKALHELSKLDTYRPPDLPEGYDWPGLLAREGDELERHYRATLEVLGQPARDHGRHLQQGTKPHPGTGHAHPPGQGPD